MAFGVDPEILSGDQRVSFRLHFGQGSQHQFY